MVYFIVHGMVLDSERYSKSPSLTRFVDVGEAEELIEVAVLVVVMKVLGVLLVRSEELAADVGIELEEGSLIVVDSIAEGPALDVGNKVVKVEGTSVLLVSSIVEGTIVVGVRVEVIEVSPKESVETEVLVVKISKLSELLEDSMVIVGTDELVGPELLATEVVELSVKEAVEVLLVLTNKEVEVEVDSKLVDVKIEVDEFKARKLELAEIVGNAELIAVILRLAELVETPELIAVELPDFEIEIVLGEGRTPVPGRLRVGKVAEDVAFVVVFDHG